MEFPQLRPGENNAVSINDEIFRTHFALPAVTGRALAKLALLGSRCLLLGFSLRGFRNLPSWRRGFCRCFSPFQICCAAPPLNSYPVLLTHMAFYRMEGEKAQCESKRESPRRRRLVNEIATAAAGLIRSTSSARFLCHVS